MKFLASTLFLAASALALPAELETRTGTNPQTVSLVFHAGPVSYDMSFPADGVYHPTPRPDLNVNIIDALNYAAYSQCTFHTAGPQTLVSSIDDKGAAHIIVGPPQPILGVTCQGSCIGTYGDCYRNGQFLGVCCNGFCAANKCRPWVQPS